jgi:hypothetical protein
MHAPPTPPIARALAAVPRIWGALRYRNRTQWVSRIQEWCGGDLRGRLRAAWFPPVERVVLRSGLGAGHMSASSRATAARPKNSIDQSPAARPKSRAG